MPGASEVLETVMAITGAAQYIGSMAAGSASVGVLAAAEAGLAAATEVLLGALSLINPLLLAIGAALAILTFQIALATKALNAFSEESKKLFETAVVFKNLGVSFPIAELRQFSDAASATMGISRQALEGAAGVLARTGLNGKQIESSLTTIINTYRGSGDSIDEVTEAVARGVEGRGRALRRYGFELEDTGSKAANLARIQQQLNLRFEGAGQAFTDTLPGAVDRLHEAVTNLFSDIGERLAPLAIKALNFMADMVNFVARNIDAFLTVVAPVVEAISLVMGSGKGSSNPAAKIGHGGDPATEKTVQQIADNTSKTADVIEQAVLGGAGTRARQAFTWRDATMAMRI